MRLWPYLPSRKEKHDDGDVDLDGGGGTMMKDK